MAYDIQPILDQFDGGLVTKYEANKLDANQSPDIINVNFTGRNAVTKRRGFEIVGNRLSTVGTITSIHNYRQLDGDEILLRGRDTALEYLLVGTWTTVGGSPVFTASKKFGFLTVRNVVYLCNGYEDYAKWDGTTYTTFAANPKGNTISFFKGRVFVAGVKTPAGFNNVLYYSKLSNIEDFTAVGAPPDVGGTVTLDSEITDIIPRQDVLLIFTLNKIFSVTINDTTGSAVLTEVIGNAGNYPNGGAISVENDVFFVDAFGNIRSVGKRINYQELRTDVQSVLIDKTTEKMTFDTAADIYFNRDFLVSAKDVNGTFNSITLAWDANYGTWKRYDGINASCYTVYQNKIVFGSSVQPNVFTLDNDIYNDDGGTIFFRYSTKEFDFGNPVHWKRMRFLALRGFVSENASVTVKIIFDNNVDNAIIKTFTGSDTDIVDEGVSISFGNSIFTEFPFGSLSDVTEAVPVSPFIVKFSMKSGNFYNVRVVVEEDGKETDLILTDMQFFIESQEEVHFEPQRVK